MIHIYGIILLEKTEITIRIYEVNKTEWKLIHYQNFPIPGSTKSMLNDVHNLAETISSILADFFTTPNARYVTQWKTGAKGIPPEAINYISSSLGLEIDKLTPHREQELLCKGLFTELW